mgnify:CR=1 FL=1
MIFCMLMRAIAGRIAEDDPPAIAEAVLAALGRGRIARRRPRPSPRPPSICFTSIDILAVGVEAVEVAAASTREHHCDDDHPSDCGQHPVGSPLAKPAAARWHLHINAGNWLAAGPPSHRGAPKRGHQAGCPSNSQALRSRFWVYLFFYKRKKSTADDSPPLHAEVS